MTRSELAHVERHQGHAAQAAVLYRQTIVDWRELGNRAAWIEGQAMTLDQAIEFALDETETS